MYRVYEDHSTDSRILFRIKLVDTNLDIDKMFKLTTTKTTTNMHLYDYNDRIKKYNSINEIMDDHYDARLKLYDSRKKYILDKLNKSISLNRTKMKFITYVIDDNIVIYKNKKENIISKLEEYDFPLIDNSYNYLLNMSITQFTHEKIDELKNIISNLTEEFNTLKNTSIKDMWLHELNELFNQL